MKYLKTFENENHLEETHEQGSHYMFFNNINSIKHYISEIEQLNQEKISELLDNGHDWAADHITVAKECIQQVFDFLNSEMSPNSIEEESPMYSEPIIPEENIQEIENKSEIVESFKEFSEKK